MLRPVAVLALLAALVPVACSASVSVEDVVAADMAAGNLNFYTSGGMNRHLLQSLNFSALVPPGGFQQVLG